MRKKVRLWHYLTWNVVFPFVISQVPAAAIAVFEATHGGTPNYDLAAIAGMIGAIASTMWTLIDWRLAQLSDQIEADVETARSSARSDIELYRRAIFEGLHGYESDVIRTLHYDDATGVLLNTTAKDSRNAPRNVLLNNKTVQTILKSVLDAGEDVLEATGFGCGRDFGGVVTGLHGPAHNDLLGLLSEWFRYDSNAGFGKFVLMSETVSGHSPEIRIVLHYNFLTSGDTFNKPGSNLCAFMRGYIKGVFSSLSDEVLSKAGMEKSKLTVLHEPKDCTCLSQDEDRGCVFHVTG